MLIQEQIPLHIHTTLKLGGPAAFFVSVDTVSELKDALAWCKEHTQPHMFLGGGSNILFSDNGYKGLVIHMNLKGITYKEQNDLVCVTAAAGESWDNLVQQTVARNVWGLENLSGIPGTVGAAPIQNIGAYGVEVKNVVTQVRVFNLHSETFDVLTPAECNFSYRHSVFKDEKNFIVTHVQFLLSKQPRPVLHYKDVSNYFENAHTPTIQDIRNAILTIRSKKFPDLLRYGTAGSFFKNPIVTKEKAEELRETYPQIPLYREPNGGVKVSLAWVLDNILHMKNFWVGNVGTFERQPLVVVTKEGATAHDVCLFAKRIQEKVFEEIGVHIDREVCFA